MNDQPSAVEKVFFEACDRMGIQSRHHASQKLLEFLSDPDTIAALAREQMTKQDKSWLRSALEWEDTQYDEGRGIPELPFLRRLVGKGENDV